MQTFFFSLFLKKFLLYLPLKVGQITVRFPLSPLQGRGENRRRKDRGGRRKGGKKLEWYRTGRNQENNCTGTGCSIILACLAVIMLINEKSLYELKKIRDNLYLDLSQLSFAWLYVVKTISLWPSRSVIIS